ncbi:MAG: response regulator transcription factor [Candidatus Neomarinimicrobiota bacterium]|nr:response regulator transcription factor [Candidatus Neomarinimicrobiota bacterium]|tara:strand:- start:1241 stop:1924 length:684 start_codon:yes stop_codon:yes gene_type:complete
MKKKLVLIVDDEKDLRKIIRYNLEQEGIASIEASDGSQAIDLLSKNPSLIILDIMMPGKDGYEVCKIIRDNGNTVPIVFLTAMDREFDELKGLEVGGDDYIRKPFSPRILVARINSIFRRIDQINQKGSFLQYDGLEADTKNYVVTIDGDELHLPRKEFELLAFFMNEPDIIFKRDALLASIWEDDVYVVDRTIDVHINRIRSKLGPYRDWIETIKGVGYRFRPKVK